LNGAVPPFGSLFKYKTYVDESLFKQGDEISFNAGLRSKSMIMKTIDYKIIEDPLIINIIDN
jgi:prolyl-tRNA editing enzyme YbaK/EbsC (Cys-tRNA(Pro) deacylase)